MHRPCHFEPAIFDSEQGRRCTGMTFTAVAHRVRIAINIARRNDRRPNKVFTWRRQRPVIYEEMYLTIRASMPSPVSPPAAIRPSTTLSNAVPRGRRAPDGIGPGLPFSRRLWSAGSNHPGQTRPDADRRWRCLEW